VLIQLRLRDNRSLRAIAAELGVAPSTVSREVRRVDGCYNARKADLAAQAARARPKEGKLAVGTWLRAEVVRGLNERRSPEQVAGRLRVKHPGEDDRYVSHETIYQALYVQAAGALRHELKVAKALRSGRTTRKPRSKLPPVSGKPWVAGARIADRPPQAADRAVPGHWEGDLVIGKGGQSALISLVERASRTTLIGRVGGEHGTDTVTGQLAGMIASLPGAIFESITWDQGSEMAGHAGFTVVTGCPVFFADPHSPWQRPTNENTNGLIRDFFPKGTDFNLVTDAEVAEVQRLLNTRPRKVLGFATPYETLNQLITVATTT
jgi:IS30 family transposase